MRHNHFRKAMLGSLLHLLQDWDDLLKGRPLARVFVHTNPGPNVIKLFTDAFLRIFVLS